MDLKDKSVQIYHPLFAIDDFETIVSLEIAMQTMFDLVHTHCLEPDVHEHMHNALARTL